MRDSLGWVAAEYTQVVSYYHLLCIQCFCLLDSSIDSILWCYFYDMNIGGPQEEIGKQWNGPSEGDQSLKSNLIARIQTRFSPASSRKFVFSLKSEVISFRNKPITIGIILINQKLVLFWSPSLSENCLELEFSWTNQLQIFTGLEHNPCTAQIVKVKAVGHRLYLLSPLLLRSY